METHPLSLIAVVVGIVGAVMGIASHFRSKSAVDTENRLERLINELDKRMVKLEIRQETYFDYQERYNAQILHRDDDEHKLDKLLEDREQLKPITQKESDSLEQQLEKIIGDSSLPPGTRAAAAQMLSARKARHAEC